MARRPAANAPELVSLLLQIDLDQRIPPQLYIAVAELLAWVYRLENGQTVPPAPVLSPIPTAGEGKNDGPESRD